MAHQADHRRETDVTSATQIAAAMPNPVLLCHHNHILFANTSALRLLAVDNQDDAKHVPIARHIRLTGATAGQPWRQILARKRPAAAEFIDTEGVTRAVALRLRPLSDPSHGLFLAIIEDRPADQGHSALASVNDRYRRVIDRLPTFVCLSAGGRIVYANSAAAGRLGFAGQQELVGRRLEEVLIGVTHGDALAGFAGTGCPTAMSFYTAQGFATEMSVEVYAIDEAFGTPEAPGKALYVITADSKSERAATVDRTGSSETGANPSFEGDMVRSTARVEAALSGRDALTRLADRSTFTGYLHQALSEADATSQSPAVLLLDIQRFKQINANYGVEAGDELLRHVARRLIEIADGDMLVGRLSGDEFALLIRKAGGLADILGRAARLTDMLAQPYQVFNDVIAVNTNVGVAAYPIGGDSPAALLQNAELARGKARELGANRYFLFDSELDTKVRRRKELESDIQRGLQQTEFVNYYQPQIDLASGTVVGGEALVRWHHPERGVVMPDKFIPIAEELGAIRELTEWMLYKSCRDVAQWDPWIKKPCVAVNLSPAVLMQGNFVNTVRAVLRDTNTEPQRLELEITESVIMRDVFEVSSMLQEIRALGVRLAIDDFGTGHSSLSYLKRLPIQKLKIDRSFVAELPDDRNDVSITRAIVVMAQNLGMKTLAEGIEHEKQVKFLRGLGCDEAQGFYFGRALMPDAFLDWCRRHNAASLTD